MRSWIVFAAGVCAFLMSTLLARAPGILEGWFGQAMGLWVPRLLSLATGWVPVSVTALGVLALMAWLLLRVRSGFREIRHGEASIGPLVLRGLRHVAGVTGVLLLWFYLSWGFHYSRAPLEIRAALPTSDSTTAEELERLTREAAAGANAAYLLLHGTRDLGIPTELEFSMGPGSRALEAGWGRVAPGLSLPPVVGGRYGNVKGVGLTWWLDLWDLSGIYSPFMGEAHVASNVPVMALPAIMAHEQAHQRGFARENEATLAGILAALASGDPLIRYSAWARAIRQLDGDLNRADPAAWTGILDSLYPGVRRDWQDLADWYEAHQSVGGPVASAVNDTYLRAHGVPGGILNYGRVTRLLVSWSRSNGGLLDPVNDLAPDEPGP